MFVSDSVGYFSWKIFMYEEWAIDRERVWEGEREGEREVFGKGGFLKGLTLIFKETSGMMI